MKKKICIVTGTRAEYGLLSRLIHKIHSDPDMKAQIICTGMHLSPEFGLTYQEIEGDGLEIDRKIEILMSSDNPLGTCKSMGLALISLSEAYEALTPDILLLLGDRFETFAAAAAGCVSRIPIAHIHGGELTEGAIDDAFRHAITKMSHLHFTSTEAYRRRVIQLGESPDRVFNVGALGVENILKMDLFEKEPLAQDLKIDLDQTYVMVTFHPVTAERGQTELQCDQLLKALDGLSDIYILFTKANADAEGRVVNQMIDTFAARNKLRTNVFSSMGHLRYLSAMRYAAAVIGNSSSGLIEAPSLKTPTVNIGNRQIGRVGADSVLNCLPEAKEIAVAIRHALSDEFAKKTQNVVNPYANENTSTEIKKRLKRHNPGEKKTFVDQPLVQC